MSRILLTGGSGFIAAHVLETLLQRGHSVVTTVRSPQKGNTILEAHPDLPRGVLDFVVVEDIARSNSMRTTFKDIITMATEVSNMGVPLLTCGSTMWPQRSTRPSSLFHRSMRLFTLRARTISSPRTTRPSYLTRVCLFIEGGRGTTGSYTSPVCNLGHKYSSLSDIGTSMIVYSYQRHGQSSGLRLQQCPYR